MLIWILNKNYIMPTVRQNIVLLRNISIFGIPKSMVLVIIFRVLMWPLSLINAGLRSIIHIQCLKMVSKNTRSSVIGMTENGIPSLTSDYKMKSKEKKNFRATFKTEKKIHCLSLKAEDDALFKNSSKNLPLF